MAMKFVKLAGLMLPLLLGACAATGGGLTNDTFAAPQAVELPAPPAPPDHSARLVLPTGGGLPVVGLPLGGALYLPATGGLPIVGLPLTP